jgi:hypothetical protein
MHDGRYAEALADFVWFHDHALEYKPSLHAIRLSFALGDWADLGRLYPPALEKLKSIRNEKTGAISRGEGSRALFDDVASINEDLEEEQLTCDLFQDLDQSNPELAQACASSALEGLVRCGAYELAYRYCPDTEGALLCEGEWFNKNMADHASTPEPHGPGIRRVFIEKYCEQAWMKATVLRNVAQPENARYALQWAVALVEDGLVRKRVQRMLSLRTGLV